jgi:hypothetical protein
MTAGRRRSNSPRMCSAPPPVPRALPDRAGGGPVDPRWWCHGTRPLAASEPSQADIPQASPVNAGLDAGRPQGGGPELHQSGRIRNSSATQALASTITA